MPREISQDLAHYAARVSYIVGLESNDKYSEKEAYSQLKHLWKTLKKKKKALKKDEQIPRGRMD